MGWERHGKRTYYYRSLRSGTKVTKVYCGGGAVGRAAAEADAVRRQRCRAAVLAWLDERSRWQSVAAVGRLYEEACELLVEAALLASGFHRAKRSPWRPWNAGRQALQRTGGTGHCR